MGLSVYPTPVVNKTTYFAAASPAYFYKATFAMPIGIWGVTATVTNVNPTVYIYDSSNNLLTSFTLSNTTTTYVNLATAGARIEYNIPYGKSATQIGFTQTGSILASTTKSGTLVTISSSGTYTCNYSNAWLIVIGGGGGGNCTNLGGQAGGGGGSGEVRELGPVNLSGSYSVTIGGGGSGVNTGGSGQAASGGSTIFGSLLTAGGGLTGGFGTSGGQAGGTATGSGTATYVGSSPGAAGYNGGNNGNTNTTSVAYGLRFQYAIAGAVFGGQGGGSMANASAAGNPLGAPGYYGVNATGYGNGGGGSGGGDSSSAGAPGVVYILTNFN